MGAESSDEDQNDHNEAADNGKSIPKHSKDKHLNFIIKYVTDCKNVNMSGYTYIWITQIWGTTAN